MALSARGRRQAAAHAVVALVLGLHALGLRAWAPGPAAAPAVTAPAAAPAVVPPVVPMQVRAVWTPPPAEPAPVVMPTEAPTVTPSPSRPPPAPAEASLDAGPDAAPDTPAPAGPAAHAGPGEAPPIYPTTLPPSFQWTFRMQRGMLSGTGTLGWELDGARYRLALVGSVAGVNLLEWVSVGAIDRAGVAPERFVSQTRGRSAQSTNFQRGAGKVTYSASTAEHPLPAGVQDRVSWLVQLAAVVAAAPERYAAPGTPLTLPVAGTRDVGLWQFVALGPQTVQTPAGSVEALAFRREAKRANDTRGEVWLDPRRHHLPVRVVLSTIDGNGRASDTLALALESTTP
ncbi:MAG: DUF3108 domain-containing protein, partial [Burkholderiaceae bacterium]|nr:DUF3108 domain-containing protein [Burkholderiaceae bacterium]